MNERKLTVTEAARNFAHVVNRAFYRGESTILFRSGDAVARIAPVGSIGMSGAEFAERWIGMAHLEPTDAGEFAHTIEEARSQLSMPQSKWD